MLAIFMTVTQSYCCLAVSQKDLVLTGMQVRIWTEFILVFRGACQAFVFVATAATSTGWKRKTAEGAPHPLLMLFVLFGSLSALGINKRWVVPYL